MCCRYIALPIDEPEDRGDFDDIRWYIMHKNITVFVEDGDWFLYIAADCRHLQPDFRCGIYATRPRICREYTTENCDYHSGEYGWEHHFTCPEHLDAYVREFFARKPKGKAAGGRRKTAKPKKSGSKRLGPNVKVRKLRRKPDADRRYADATADIAGVPLPVLRD
jgi:Fe-S-cluster containining protein